MDSDTSSVDMSLSKTDLMDHSLSDLIT